MSEAHLIQWLKDIEAMLTDGDRQGALAELRDLIAERGGW
jgi:hypothetical protein